MKAPKEGDIVKQCLDYLRVARGFFVWRNNTGGAHLKGGHFVRFNSPGAPDLMALLPASADGRHSAGRLAGVEVKSPRGRLRPAQRAWLEAAGRQGCLAICVRSLDQLRDALAAEGYPEE